MIRVGLVINLSEAVRTFFKSPKFTFQKLPLETPRPAVPALELLWKSMHKNWNKIKKYPDPSKPQNNHKKAVHFFYT